MEQAFLIDGIRTPIGSFKGALSGVRADDLAALVIQKLAERNPSVPTDKIEDVILGCANQAGDDNRNVARMALLLAGLPMTVAGETVNRLCASGMSAVAQAARAIKANDGEVFIAGGVENMTRGPWVISKTESAYGQEPKMYDSAFGWRFINPKLEKLYGVDAMGITAENLAEMYNISREDQDLFAYNSQQKATKAQQNGVLAEEITPVLIPQKKGDPLSISADEFIKPNSSLDKLSQLRPAFKKDGTVTAGNASGLNDGAAALLMASKKAIKAYDLIPKARILSSAVVGVEPRIMGIGPVEASRKALAKAGLTLADMDVLEMNEAFAAQVLACSRALGLADDDSRINPNGGAIALGHPLGMSGARIVLAAANELQRQQKRYALATMCIGVGQGYAVVIERV
ncbi:MAG: 3-oxoadipyl-CoA thiolase [Saprospiraceae bacterium]|nr:3-oxoadipyl-CoA thiolase [Saprospiraceae bacterium]